MLRHQYNSNGVQIPLLGKPYPKQTLDEYISVAHCINDFIVNTYGKNICFVHGTGRQMVETISSAQAKDDALSNLISNNLNYATLP